jgi:hypothetical protein
MSSHHNDFLEQQQEMLEEEYNINNFKRVKSTPRKLIYIASMLSDVQECLNRGDIQSASYIIYNAKENLFYLEREQEWVERVMEEQNEEYINYISED